MRKKNYRKWWKRLGFRRELRDFDKTKVAAQELLEQQTGNWKFLEQEADLDFRSHYHYNCETCGDCHFCEIGDI